MISLAMQQRWRPGMPTASLGRPFRRACIRPVLFSWATKLFEDLKRHDPATSKHCVAVRRYPLRLSPQLSLQTQFQICLTRAYSSCSNALEPSSIQHWRQFLSDAWHIILQVLKKFAPHKINHQVSSVSPQVRLTCRGIVSYNSHNRE